MKALLHILLACLLAMPVAPALADAGSTDDPYSSASFNRWLFERSGEHGNERSLAFADFVAFLRAQGVGDVVPPWQLLRTDSDYAQRCGIAPFQLPPRARWAAIVPALRLVRDDVIPVVGRVAVHSAWRSDELNACVNGAARSRHLAFSALDLIALDRPDKRRMFADLCNLHRRIGAQRRMGLGTYFDPARPALNQNGRFHIDADGFRSWGFDYTRNSSYCR